MRKFVLLFIFLIFADAHGQSIDKISTRCKAPNSSLFSSVLVDATGTIIYTPCPNKPNNIFGQVKLLDPSQLPTIANATNYFLLKGTVDNGTNQNLIISNQELTITQNVSSPSIYGRFESTTINGAYTGGNLVGAYFTISNRNSTQSITGTNFTALGATASIDAPVSAAYGGQFTAFTGGSGGGATPLIVGVNGITGTHNTSNAVLIGGQFEVRNGLGGGTGDTAVGIGVQAKLTNFLGTFSDARGFACSQWNFVTGSVGMSSCIYADPSIDTFGAGTHYFINSLSASPSRLAGDVSFTDNTKGIILRSPDNTCHLLAVSNANALSATTVACP